MPLRFSSSPCLALLLGHMFSFSPFLTVVIDLCCSSIKAVTWFSDVPSVQHQWGFQFFSSLQFSLHLVFSHQYLHLLSSGPPLSGSKSSVISTFASSVQPPHLVLSHQSPVPSPHSFACLLIPHLIVALPLTRSLSTSFIVPHHVRSTNLLHFLLSTTFQLSSLYTSPYLSTPPTTIPSFILSPPITFYFHHSLPSTKFQSLTLFFFHLFHHFSLLFSSPFTSAKHAPLSFASTFPSLLLPPSLKASTGHTTHHLTCLLLLFIQLFS